MKNDQADPDLNKRLKALYREALPLARKASRARGKYLPGLSKLQKGTETEKKLASLVNRIEKTARRAGQKDLIKKYGIAALRKATDSKGRLSDDKTEYETPEAVIEAMHSILRTAPGEAFDRKGLFVQSGWLKRHHLHLYQAALAHFGSYPKFRHALGAKTAVSEKGVLDTPDALTDYARRHILPLATDGYWPPQSLIDRTGHGTFLRKVYAIYPGGPEALAKAIGLVANPSERDSGRAIYGSPEKILEYGRRNVVPLANDGKMPSQRELKKKGLGGWINAVQQKYPGGYARIVRDLGLKR